MSQTPNYKQLINHLEENIHINYFINIFPSYNSKYKETDKPKSKSRSLLVFIIVNNSAIHILCVLCLKWIGLCQIFISWSPIEPFWSYVWLKNSNKNIEALLFNRFIMNLSLSKRLYCNNLICLIQIQTILSHLNLKGNLKSIVNILGNLFLF